MSDEIRKIISLTEAANRVTNEDNGKMPMDLGSPTSSAPTSGDPTKLTPTAGKPGDPVVPPDKPEGPEPTDYEDWDIPDGLTPNQIKWMNYWWRLASRPADQGGPAGPFAPPGGIWNHHWNSGSKGSRIDHEGWRFGDWKKDDQLMA